MTLNPTDTGRSSAAIERHHRNGNFKKFTTIKYKDITLVHSPAANRESIVFKGFMKVSNNGPMSQNQKNPAFESYLN
jgi:hypothetical protein